MVQSSLDFLMLAEIADKMGNPSHMLVIALVLSLTCAWGLYSWWLTIPSILLAGFGNFALWLELSDPYMRSLILGELGWSWVIGECVAWNSPFVICWIGLFFFHRWQARAKRIAQGYCQNCGYDLTGNVSGICPECGRAIPPACSKQFPTAECRRQVLDQINGAR